MLHGFSRTNRRKIPVWVGARELKFLQLTSDLFNLRTLA
jgi:hypothetical protein